VSRFGFIPSLLRLLLAVGVVACLVGFAGHGSSDDERTGGHLAAMHAEHGKDPAPAPPEHHGGTDSHAHGCMTAMPGVDGAVLLAPDLAPVAVAGAVPHSGTGGHAGVPAAPPRPRTDRDVLCVWRT
jgi:hypothetical protein